MLPVANGAAFALTALALIVIPGPSVLFVVGRSLALGRRGGLVSVVGNSVGTLPALAAVSLGLGRIVSESLLVFETVKIVGAAYLIYLGAQTVRHRRSTPLVVTPARSTSGRRLFGQGVLVGVSNPKTIVFFVAVLPQFVDRSSGAVPLQLALLGAIFTVVALLSDSTWALAAGTARSWFGRDARRSARLTAGGGVMMIGLGGVLLVTGHRR